MFRLSSLVPTTRTARYVTVAVFAFALGSGTVVTAKALDVFQLADGTNPAQLAHVDVAGNVATTVSNLPAVQAVSGTVSVTNASGGATLEARDADEAARHPFLRHLFWTSPSGATIECASFTVPASARLAVEDISILMFVPTGQSVDVYITFTSGGTSGLFRLAQQEQRPWGTSDRLMASRAVKLYADPSTSFQFCADRGGVGILGLAGFQADVSGHLVTVP